VNEVGIEELHRQIESHYQTLCKEGRLSERRRLQRKQDFIKTLERKLTTKLLRSIEQDGQMSSYLEKVEKGELDPYSAADELLKSGDLLADCLRR
jgi:putative protein kinase ArgK-like GTPase of G3E family